MHAQRGGEQETVEKYGGSMKKRKSCSEFKERKKEELGTRKAEVDNEI